MKNLCLVLNDQLNENISTLKTFNKREDAILLIEARDEYTYVKHHKKKIAFQITCQRHFAKHLEEQGYIVHYAKLLDPNTCGTVTKELERWVQILNPESIVVMQPSDYRLYQQLENFKNKTNVPLQIIEDNRFLASVKDFAGWAKDRKELRMEFFYREMRKKYNILMENNQPMGGKWNYDSENRLSPKSNMQIPDIFRKKQNSLTTEVCKMVKNEFSDHFGDMEPFHFGVTRKDALEALDHFIHYRLANFGDYQDAMVENEPWMYHSLLSFYLNIGLLEPLECIKAAEYAYLQASAPLNAVEGFIRQILGWREYIRGIYWLKMPDYKQENFLQAKRKLPEFFWTTNTKMNCLKQSIRETKENAYAHHIQRLMVLGNFCLLTGIHPNYVNEWYLIVYADAYEWVELPNVSGMVLFADGGYLASKPYAAGGAFINKMSDYCKKCHFKIKNKTGDDACPFNYLYWNFLIENRDKLEGNPRLNMPYNTLKKMDDVKLDNIKESAKSFLNILQPNDPKEMF